MSEIIFTFLVAAIPVVGLIGFIFIVAQSTFNAAYSGLKQKIIVLKMAAAVVIWGAISYAMLHVIGESIIAPIDFDRETPRSFLEESREYWLFVGLAIYILVGIGLGFWIKGQAKWFARQV
jgi:succinate dehydrogenase/fumarate reductase cytochrome b subunit